MQANSPKCLGIFIDTQLDFRKHLKNIFTKFSQNIALLRKFQNTLPKF